MRDAYRITGNDFSIITLFRSGSLGTFELTSILLLSMTLAKRIAKLFTKALRSPQKLQVMAVVLGADPVFGFPWLLKLHACASWSLSVWDHTIRISCSAKGWTAQLHPRGSRVELLAGSFFCGDVGAGEPWAKWGCCQSPSAADVLHPFL